MQDSQQRSQREGCKRTNEVNDCCNHKQPATPAIGGLTGGVPGDGAGHLTLGLDNHHSLNEEEYPRN